MITPENYLSKVAGVDVSSLPSPVQKGYAFVMKATAGGTDWNAYQNSAAIKKTIDLYFVALTDSLAKTARGPRKQMKKRAASNWQQLPTSSPNRKSKVIEREAVQWVERMPDELRFIKRYLSLDGKIKAKEEILRFINSLQKAIVEKRIRKNSPYAEQIKYVQEGLIKVYNTMKAKTYFKLDPETAESFRKLTGSEKVLASIGFIKRYILMNEKHGMKEKAKQLLAQINRAVDKHKIADSDPYTAEIHEIKKNLKAFTLDKGIKTLEIEQATLNGLEGILGCACHSLSGVPRSGIMNSIDFANVEFETLGFTGKWLELIGDPSSNFSAMVYGKPKMGKSYFCIDFAGYLARHHGRVLYVAKEEGLDVTLQKKLADKAVAHTNLDVSSYLPASLEKYGFIFLDSVNRLGLTPDDLNRLRSQNPAKSFVYIFQSTKDGNFRGGNSFQHDVDIVIEVPQRGKAIQMGRFNQGGEMDIF